MSSYDSQITAETKKIVQWLAQDEYDKVEERTNRVRLSAKQLRSAIEEYGRHLVVPPEGVFDELDVIEIDTQSDSKAWSVRFDLWTQEEGRSDLSLEMTMREPKEPDGELIVELDNLHVL